MDLETFLASEKRRLAEERQCLYEQTNELNSTLKANTTSMTQKNTSSLPNGEDKLSKQTKDWINIQCNRKTEDIKAANSNSKTKRQDDMEQWVSDTFYSYFPGFSNEYQKRQNELQKRQLENQENLIKHQMLNAGQSRKKKNFNVEAANINSARSNNSSLTSNTNSGDLFGATKTEMEIINVNNSNYVPSKHLTNTVRPDSARYKLLQDLRHTNLTNLVNSSSEDTIEINRKQAESARKKEYQRELMQQIEEKRRMIKLLKDKEHQQEEVLTRRLQEQLKTMKLEEQLEKERLKAVKARFDSEQNRLTREHLLAKLENDSRLLLDEELGINNCKESSLNNETNKENIFTGDDNKVYKYFSNSEKHEYHYRSKSSSLPLEIDQNDMAKIERECFHLSEKICPMCNEPLKELENFCLRCQSRMSFHLTSQSIDKNPSKHGKSIKSKSKENDADKNFGDCSFFLICTRCERLYSWCKTCSNKSDVCRACQNKRNLCMSCRKTLCSFCLEEIACGKDAESLHINDSVGSFDNRKNIRNGSAQEITFHVVNDIRESTNNDNKNNNMTSSPHQYSSLNNLDYSNNPPYSINIEQNSIFHPDSKTFSLFSPDGNKDSISAREVGKNVDIYEKEHFQSSLDIDDKNIERLRRDTDKKLSRYVKNYGDLAYQTRGTQTTPTTTGRRDIVINGEQSLSIPLLREMPKMTRMEKRDFKENSKELENLKHRWDIPAIQKYTISSLSPRVITQIGAIKKQLQMERIFAEDGDC